MIDWDKIVDITPAQAQRASEYDEMEYEYTIAVLYCAFNDIEYACSKIRRMAELAKVRGMLDDIVPRVAMMRNSVLSSHFPTLKSGVGTTGEVGNLYP